MIASNIKHRTTNLEFPTLTKITSIPSYTLLQILKYELKAIAVSVSSDLGGGSNGHLGVMLIVVEYT